MSYRVKIEQAMAKIVIADLKNELANPTNEYIPAYISDVMSKKYSYSDWLKKTIKQMESDLLGIMSEVVRNLEPDFVIHTIKYGNMVFSQHNDKYYCATDAASDDIGYKFLECPEEEYQSRKRIYETEDLPF